MEPVMTLANLDWALRECSGYGAQEVKASGAIGREEDSGAPCAVRNREWLGASGEQTRRLPVCCLIRGLSVGCEVALADDLFGIAADRLGGFEPAHGRGFHAAYVEAVMNPVAGEVEV